ncbi:MAG: serine acetyltransferase [Firmicutes bacterium]|nr:serine acetyltransferase [Bacillota bacterium]
MIKFLKNLYKTIKGKDPAIHSKLEVILYPFFKAYIFYKISNFFYRHKLYFLARLFSEIAKKRTSIEIHPGATIGKNFFIDHGCGVVIGETTIIKDNVTLYHGVTLGGTGKDKDKRHPTIEDNVTIGAGSIILGNITIGSNSVIGAGSIVLKDVEPNSTITGIYK